MHQVTDSPLSYRTLRGFQITTVFCVTVAVQEWIRHPHAGWTGFALMMILGGFDNGTAILRAFHRFSGVFMGLFTGYFFWFLGHLDYRLMFFIVPLTIFFIFFSAGTAYSTSTIFAVCASVIGFGYYHSQSSFIVSFYLIDYGMCTVIAFAIILVFEYFWFRRYNMMQRFINDIQIEVINNLYHLIHLLNQEKIRRVDWYNGCTLCTASIFEMDRLLCNSQFILGSERAVGDEFNQFVVLTHRVYVGLKALYLAYYTKRHRKFDYYQLVEKVQADLIQLKALIAFEKAEDVTYGVLHAAPG